MILSRIPSQTIILENQAVTSVRNGKTVGKNYLSFLYGYNVLMGYPYPYLCHIDFLVTDPLPNVTFPLSRNWAGNIPVNRTNHPNDTLFFWGFESKNGSLTAAANENSSEPWALWLNGGLVLCLVSINKYKRCRGYCSSFDIGLVHQACSACYWKTGHCTSPKMEAWPQTTLVGTNWWTISGSINLCKPKRTLL